MPEEECEAVKLPPRIILDEIVQAAERSEKILDGLEIEDSTYRGFCEKMRMFSARYDDEGLVVYITTQYIFYQ